jgi:molecular chaperone HtpG
LPEAHCRFIIASPNYGIDASRGERSWHTIPGIWSDLLPLGERLAAIAIEGLVTSKRRGSGAPTCGQPWNTMYSIKLPLRVAQRLAAEPRVDACITQAMIQVGPWLQASGMPFFPGFTDHGVGHLQRVIETADWLIADDAWGLLSARDIGCLLLAILLHDSAMHLTEDGLRALLRDGDRPPRYPEFDRLTWRELWQDYLLESAHWSSRQRARVLGAVWEHRSIHELGVRRPGGITDLSESDRLYVGEFLRRHHTRLAHEFAVLGVPGPAEGLIITPPDGVPQLLDIAGLVARSHGMNLRATFSYLQQTYDGTGPLFGMAPVYLMGVLRIADFLDLHAERAPADLLRVKGLRSVVSQREWDAHAAITDIRYNGTSDPERLEIIASPRSASVYAAVLRWVDGIQAELDHTWAVLGEVYGGRGDLSKLSLRVRRITSPLQDPTAYAAAKKLRFIPEPARFTTAGVTLLPLLARPLYGDAPEVGIRELLQNAIDAVNELGARFPRGPARDGISAQLNPLPAATGADVCVCVSTRAGAPDRSTLADVPENWECWVEVADRGVGMAAETIRDYFLRAGATLRNSLEWLKVFAPDAELRVLRSGRFGVGTLALFALGDEIDVTTRHYTEADTGTRFRAALLDEEIELRRVPAPIGTTIRVRITQETFNLLADEKATPGRNRTWDWYCLDSPRVHLSVRRGDQLQVREQTVVVSLDAPERTGWRVVGSPESQRVLWRPGRDNWLHRLYANGFFVRAWHRNFDQNWFGNVPELKQPDVLVVDPAARLPLTLARDGLTTSPSYVEGVLREALLMHCAWLLAEAARPATERDPFQAPTWETRQSMQPGDGVVEGPGYLVTDDAIVPFAAWHLHHAGIRRLNVYFTSVNWHIRAGASRTISPSRIFHEGLVPSPYASVRVEPFGGFGEVPLAVVALSEFRSFMRRVVGQEAIWGAVVPGHMSGALYDASIRSLFGERVEIGSVEGGDAAPWSVYDPRSPLIDLAPVRDAVLDPSGRLRSTDAARGIAQFAPQWKAVPAEGAFGRLWEELELPPAIPLEENARRATCGRALEELKEYVIAPESS